MYAIPIDDTSAFAIKDEDDETWRCYYIDFDPLRVDSFKTPVPTGCAREAGNLLKLVSTGSVLWAIDEEGFFRLTSDGWALTELEDIANADGQT